MNKQDKIKLIILKIVVMGWIAGILMATVLSDFL